MNLTRSFRHRVLSFIPNPLALSIDPRAIQHNQSVESQRHNHQHDPDHRRAQMRLIHRVRLFFSPAIRDEYTSLPTVAATTNTTTTTCSVCVIRPPSQPRLTSVLVQMRLMFRFGADRNSFLGAEVLMAVRLKLLRAMLDAQVVPNHVAHHRNKYDD
jgi:hypothetical protein